ncbi:MULTISPECIES: hypothetical protein [unclassified Pseudoalteromonas]|uniref:hypothetical protein n=1 Tax=unclassified Pseudoalteromonas TaxID=194690 RepID=UPI000CF6377A|nr:MULTISPECIES: hypothetical protein [unclassified Pseudoalteromonas]MBS3797932.1 hypothetical protein [Pseudoalteromonas sp. BDTF-M6]
MTESPASPPSNTDEKWLEAEVCYLNLEGGFFGLVTRDGKRLLPLNLPATFSQAGAQVKLQGYAQRDMMTIQQWGTPFHLTQIEFIDPVNKAKPHNPLI